MRLEPSFSITITPTFFDGDPSDTGGGVVNIQNVGDFISMSCVIDSARSGSLQNVFGKLASNNTPMPIKALYFTGCKFGIDITNDVASGGFLKFIVNEPTSNKDKYQTALDSPYLDFFQGGFIVQIQTLTEVLFTGVIDARPSVRYSQDEGLEVSVPIVSYTKKLNDSIGVQTLEELRGGTQELNTLVAQQYNFNDLLDQFVSQTVLKNAMYETLYYKNSNEIPAGSEGGTAINQDTSIYVYSNPSDSKYNILMTALYPYQRLFYTNGSGNFIITPMQYYYDVEQSWDISIVPVTDPSKIQLYSIDTELHDCDIYNRVLVTWNNFFIQFNQSSGIGDEYSSAQSIATPVTEYYPRIAELVENNNNLQTKFVTHEPNPNMLLDPSCYALLFANNINNISGLVNKSVLIDGNLDTITNPNTKYNQLKYYLNFVALREMAQILAKETIIVLTIDYNMVYYDKLQTFRNIPLNQIVRVKMSNYNRLFAGLQEFYCFKYDFSFNIRSGAIIKLYLMKPYVFMGLWSDEMVVEA